MSRCYHPLVLGYAPVDSGRVVPQQRPGRSKQDYQTPPEFLDAVRRRLQIGDFAIDLAATKENTVCEDYYTVTDNALVQPWVRIGLGSWGWCNPPFANLRPWVEKAYRETADHYASTAMLVPAGVGSNWWRDFVHQKCLVLLLNGRITFVGESTCYPKDCCLLLYSPKSTPSYEVWTWY